MKDITISRPKWTSLCWLWAFCGALQLIPPIDWYAAMLIGVIITYESGVWTGGVKYVELRK